MKHNAHLLSLVLVALLLLCSLAMLNGCGKESEHVHEWVDANCVSPKTCKSCHETQGNPLGHSPMADDGDCTTPVLCATCQTVLTAGQPSHTFDNACDTSCNACSHTREASHTPMADDDDCTTDVLCSVCGVVVTEGSASHTFDHACDTSCNACSHTREASH
ncbi:MAG: hypothetical protein J6R42_01070, partial [Clostridia bacterium]|nr:hypothetical protein [Clostridia bacterium]